MSTANEELLPDEIVTRRLKLRPYRFSDVPEMYAYVQEPGGNRFLEGSGEPLTEKQTEEIIARHILVDKDVRNVWAITIDDVPVGAISINFAKARRIAEIGYHIKQALWGQGYASEAAKAVVDTAFATCRNLQRIQANIHPDNVGSIRVAQRAGMAFEATLRSYSYVAGEVTDEVVYSILRSK
ncbi:MAG: GNAT family N-acetyltransferase [bacterium]